MIDSSWCENKWLSILVIIIANLWAEIETPILDWFLIFTGEALCVMKW
jgi:hypothetical protein